MSVQKTVACQVQTPILILAFNRPHQTKTLIERLREVKPKTIYYAVDGPRENRVDDQCNCTAVSELSSTIDWTPHVYTKIRTENLGRREGVADAINWFFENVNEGIILEDDWLPTLNFFPYCQELLERYRKNQQIFMISGSNLDLINFKDSQTSYVFSQYLDIHAWASWKRAWQAYDINMSPWRTIQDKNKFLKLHFSSRKERRLRRNDFDKAADDGNNTWKHQWFFTCLYNEGLCIMPTMNLVHKAVPGHAQDVKDTRVADRSDKINSETDLFQLSLLHPEKIEKSHIFEYRITRKFCYGPKTIARISFKIIKNCLYPIIPLVKLLLYWIHNRFENFIARNFFSYPEVINLNATDICNSGCTMCNIWKQKKKFEFNPDQLKTVLGDPLFKKVRYVGVTGGEPTLRKDLPEIYASIIKALPRIQGLSIITNCIRSDEVINRVSESAKICTQNNIPFSLMVSLDGVGKVHDRVRGTKGNFDNTVKVIDHFRNKTDIPVSIGATISKENVWDVDDLLFFMRQRNLYGRFRIAEFIKRLYNEDKEDVIRNFDGDELYQLALFFKKLEFSFETDSTYQRTYRSIHNMLLGGNRLISCPYKSKGIVLNSKAEVSYCAPKSKILGSVLNSSGKKLYKTNLHEKNRILSNECDNCIHDYHAPITYEEYKSEIKEALWKKFFSLNNPYLHPMPLQLFARSQNKENTSPHVLIVGWYGTETVGDKAILGGICNYYGQTLNEFKLTVASLYPFVTNRTLKELNINGEVINAHSRRLFQESASADYIVIGGGPLMDIEELSVPLLAFKAAKCGKKVVFGCGIGPLTVTTYYDATVQILKHADEVWVRDEASLTIARKMTNRLDSSLQCIGDPAKPYIKLIADSINRNPKNELSCFLREWTHEYARHLNPQEFKKKRIAFERGLAKYIKQTAEELDVDNIRFYHMHNFVIGEDDRDFSRRFIYQYFQDDERVSFDRGLSTVASIVQAMLNAKSCVCMRFHSVLFASTLGIDYSAIDYTLGGKILNYLKDNDEESRLISIDEISR